MRKQIRVIGTNGEGDVEVAAIQRELDSIIYDGTRLRPSFDIDLAIELLGDDSFCKELIQSALDIAVAVAGYEHTSGGCTWIVV